MNIFKVIKSYNERKLKFLGIKIYHKYKIGDVVKRKYFGGIYSSVRKKYSTKYYLFGIMVFRKTDKLKKLRDMISYENAKIVQKLITTAVLHQKTFLPFKNKHHDESIVLVGAGPSVSDFKPIKNVRYCGLNRAFKREDIAFDYLFATNKTGLETYEDDFINYKGNNCVKFIGDESGSEKFQISESLLLRANAHRFMNSSSSPVKELALFLETQPLYASSTVSVQAMQFLLYTNPKKIYIVGIDCSVATKGHFTGSTSKVAQEQEDLLNNDKKAIEDWTKLKEFAQIYYPDTEIISINPVGLKGIFKDIYTNENGEYIDEHGNEFNIGGMDNETLVY